MIARLNKALQPVYGNTLYMQAAQDITIGARVSKTQYQYTLVDVDIDELDHLAPILLKKLQTLPQLTDVASDQQSAEGRGQPPAGPVAWRPIRDQVDGLLLA